MNKVTIDRELLERLETWVTDDCEALRELQAILAAPRQPESEGLEAVAWVVTGISSERARSQLGRTRRAFLVSQSDAEQQHANWLPHYQSVTTDQLCRLSDAQRAIAELREECERLRAVLDGAEYPNIDRLKTLSVETCREVGRTVGSMTKALQAERDTLRQQLTELDATVERLEAGIPRLQEQAYQARKKRDKLAGLLADVKADYTHAIHWEDMHASMKRIDAALAEVNK